MAQEMTGRNGKTPAGRAMEAMPAVALLAALVFVVMLPFSGTLAVLLWAHSPTLVGAGAGELAAWVVGGCVLGAATAVLLTWIDRAARRCGPLWAGVLLVAAFASSFCLLLFGIAPLTAFAYLCSLVYVSVFLRQLLRAAGMVHGRPDAHTRPMRTQGLEG